MTDATPPTYLPTVGGVPVPQDKIFDPAVLQFAHGFRLGGPTIGDPARRRRWLDHHRAVGTEVIRQLALGPIGSSLMLRGSWLLALWYGERAREPHDVDYVSLGSIDADELVAGVVATLGAASSVRDLGVRGADIELSPIWTYDRVEGRRLALPWAVADDLVGVLQIDLTFDEPFDEPPVPWCLDDGTEVLAATPSQSLVWKLEWLLTDMYPQGKDLYDAVLLHEAAPLTAPQWRRAVDRVRSSDGWHRPTPPTADDLYVPDTEWAWFCEEYPQMTAGLSLPDLRRQLVDAIATCGLERVRRDRFTGWGG